MSSSLISLGIGSPADIPHFVLAGLSPQEASGDVNYLISLGIGSPADITHFILGGLSPDGSGGIDGSLVATLGAVTASATGTVAIQGAADVTLGAVTVDAQGSVGNIPIEGALVATLGAVTVTAVGVVPIVGSLAVTLGAVTSSVSVAALKRLVGLSRTSPVRLGVSAMATSVRDIQESDGFYTNTDFPFEVEVVDENGDPVDPTGWALSWVLKKRASDSDENAIVTKTSGDGISVTDGANGVCLVLVSAADTDDTVKSGTYVHELKRTDTGSERVILNGLAVLKRSAHLS